MGKRPSYSDDFRNKLMELARAGRSVSDLAREFDVSRQSIMNWLKQDDLDAGRRSDGLTREEHAELVELRRENRQLKIEREILSKAAAWFARETTVDAKPRSRS